jgi:hypothetical protein
MSTERQPEDQAAEGVFVRLDSEFAARVADSVIKEQGFEGYEATLMRCLAQRLIPGLAAELKPGARIALDSFSPPETPSTGLYLEKTETGLLLKTADPNT